METAFAWMTQKDFNGVIKVAVIKTILCVNMNTLYKVME